MLRNLINLTFHLDTACLQYRSTMKLTIYVVVYLFSVAQCQLIPMGEFPTKVTAFVRNAANFAVNTMNGLIDTAYWDVLTGIHNATVEANMGMIYRMDLTLQASTCRNIPASVDATTARCPTQLGATAKYCHVEVLVDSSHNPKYSLKQNDCHI